MYFIEELSMREITRRTGRDRETVRRAVRSREAPSYARPTRPSKLDPSRTGSTACCATIRGCPPSGSGELVEPLGFTGGQTIVDSYLRDVRPLFLPARTFQRTIYRPGEILQFDLFHPRQEIPVGHGQTRQGYVLVAALGYSRAAAGALVFSK